MIQVTATLFLDERAIEESFVLASGPGGQNVNKVSTAVQLRCDLNRAGLPDDVRRRLERLAGKRVSREGVLLIVARQHRTQERNRAAAMEALLELVRRATVVPKRRRATRPTNASRVRRLTDKAHRGRLKQTRSGAPD